MPAQTVIFIPARYASQRFPGKPLAELTGATGETKSLIQRSWEAAKRVQDVAAAYVLTDDYRIAEAVRSFGGDVLMTSTTCRNGTERCAEGVALLDTTPDIVVNIQGDAPLTPPDYVQGLIAAIAGAGPLAVATPVLPTDGAHLTRLRADRTAGRVGGTTVVQDAQGKALYFSKEVLPFDTATYEETAVTPVLHHVGVYAYTPQALTRYMAAPPSTLETLEGLEQLRFLDIGLPVSCVPLDPKGRAFWELNNPSDIPIIEEIMQKEGIA
ncbi:MAG: 3-deoxy-manno-octulosonate cytidylyltransferase [Rhodobacteraceae bacterium]|nr:3-deoxy-manno-octulosonate cytidylyltransferase [Paracoccaceae bacterium]